MAGLQVNTAWDGLLGFYLPAKLCFFLSHFILWCCYLCSLERHILCHFPCSILVLILPVECINGTLFSGLVIFVTKLSESTQWKWRSISTAIWLMAHSDSWCWEQKMEKKKNFLILIPRTLHSICIHLFDKDCNENGSMLECHRTSVMGCNFTPLHGHHRQPALCLQALGLKMPVTLCVLHLGIT